MTVLKNINSDVLFVTPLSEYEAQKKFPANVYEIRPDASDLFAKLCNAAKTACNASGHSKALRNERMVDIYRTKLAGMNVIIPDRIELIEMGVFNGIGSV